MTERFEAPERRPDGLAKVTGSAAYTADRQVPDALFVRYRVADEAHGIVRSIDVVAAAAMPGVRAILTGADCATTRIGRRLQDWPLLAWDRVRFTGERVAAVAADTDIQAATAAAAIHLVIDPLDSILDPIDALAADAPDLHPEAATYRYLGPGPRPPTAHPNLQGDTTVTTGCAADPEAFEAVFASAAHVIEDTFQTGRQHQGHLEPHAAIVASRPDGGADIWTTNKQPFLLRAQMADALDMPAELLCIDADVIGGDFGGKGLSYDEYVCLLLARRTGRPVRFNGDYREELSSYAPRHRAVATLRTAIDATGRILAHDADFILDGGAYAAAKPMPDLTLPGVFDTMAPYHVPHLRIRARSVYTNTVPAGHMRCPGELQAAFASESHVDRIARALGHDPVAFRRINAARSDSVTAHHQRIRQPMAREVLDQLAVEAGRAGGSGHGVALVARRMEGGRQSIQATLQPDGQVRLTTGLPDQGAGVHTVVVRIASVALDIPESRIVVERVSTDRATADLGIGASRVTYLVGRATERACARLREAIEHVATTLATVPVTIRDGALSAADGTIIPWQDVAARLGSAPIEGTFDTNVDEDRAVADFTFAGLAVDVDVDRATGQVRIVDAVLVADIGSTIINPLAHQGQIDGGFAQGIGAALMEEVVIDAGQVQSASLGEYRLPVSKDVPPLRTVALMGSPGPGPFGTKMAGELSTSPVAPAIANAIEDLTGARIRTLPMTPERVLRALLTTPSSPVEHAGAAVRTIS
jgi:CO/xanthine dehydrogenase Mo-binding subunit